MGITNFASYGDDTKPDCRCHFSVSKNMRVGTIETKPITATSLVNSISASKHRKIMKHFS